MASTEAAHVPSGEESTRLHRRALGVADIVFFIVAASAPLTVVAGGQTVAYLVTGNRGFPLLILVVGAVLVLFTTGYAAMSHHIANAGAFYAYISQGLGRIGGVGAAFIALVTYNAMVCGIYGLFGVAFGAFMADKLGIDMAWWGWCLVGWAIVGTLGLLQVNLNARVLALLLILECVVVGIYDLAIVADPGPEGLTTVGFHPSVAFGTAVGAALTFCMAAFVGFESSAIYSEETRNPKKTVARATYIAIGSIAVFYAVSTWLLSNSIGPSSIIDADALVAGGFVSAPGVPDPTTILFITGTDRLGAFWGDAATLLFATSLFAALLSFHNAVARYTFALGRERVLPPVLGRVHPRTGAPYMGSLLQSAIAVAVFGVFALAHKDPVLDLFTWLTDLGALGVFALLSLTSFSVVGYFLRDHRGEGMYTRLISPALAGVILAVMFVVALANFNVLVTGEIGAPTSDLTIILPAILFAAGLLGVLVAAWLRSSRPEIYQRIGHGSEPAGS